MPPKRGTPPSSPTRHGTPTTPSTTPTSKPRHTVLADVHSAETEPLVDDPAAGLRADVSDDLGEPEPEPEPEQLPEPERLTAQQKLELTLEPVDLTGPEPTSVSLGSNDMRESVAEQEGLLGGGGSSGGYSASPAGRVAAPAGASKPTRTPPVASAFQIFCLTAGLGFQRLPRPT